MSKSLKTHITILLLILSTICIIYGDSSSNISVSWLGNTFNGNPNWISNTISSLYVSYDGTCFVNSLKDGGLHSTVIYKNGQYVGNIKLNDNDNDNMGGISITGYYSSTIKSTIIYVANGGGNITSTKIWKFSQNGSPLNWNGKTTNIIDNLPKNTLIYSMTANNKYLYISDPNNDKILIYNSSTGDYISSFTFKRPSDLVVDHYTNLWIIQSSYSFSTNSSINTNKTYYGASTVYKYGANGKYLGINITNNNWNPSSIAINPIQSKDRLIISDYSQRSQVYGFRGLNQSNNAPPYLDQDFFYEGMFGVINGIYTQNGQISAQNYKSFYKINGVGQDSGDNMYISVGGIFPKGGDNFIASGTDLRAYYSPTASTGNIMWQLYGKPYIQMGDIDPFYSFKFYTAYNMYQYDINQNKWKYDAMTLNGFQYEQDSRNTPNGNNIPFEIPRNVFLRRLSNNKLYMFQNDANGNQGAIRIYRFENESNFAIPSARWSIISNDNKNGYIYPPNNPFMNESGKDTEYIWYDMNGNGKYESNEFVKNEYNEYLNFNGLWPDQNGHLWTCYRQNGIRRLMIEQFDNYSNPIYSFNPRYFYEIPKPFVDIHFLRYFVEEDIMYLSGWTIDNLPNNTNINQTKGSEIISIARYDNWIKNNGKNMIYKWLSDDNKYFNLLNNSICFDICDEYIFTIDINNTINVFQTENCNLITNWNPSSFFGQTGIVNIWNSGIRCNHLNNGSYNLFVEDDLKNKILVFTWTP